MKKISKRISLLSLLIVLFLGINTGCSSKRLPNTMGERPEGISKTSTRKSSVVRSKWKVNNAKPPKYTSKNKRYYK
jgi:hypothetical protein